MLNTKLLAVESNGRRKKGEEEKWKTAKRRGTSVRFLPLVHFRKRGREWAERRRELSIRQQNLANANENENENENENAS